jgi:hypothetical protein
LPATTPPPENNSPDAKESPPFHWLGILFVVLIGLTGKFIARQMHLSVLMEMLGPVIPVCASFGPFFLLFGIWLRTSKKPVEAPWAAVVLVSGTAMIALALMHLLSKLPVGR